MNLKFFRRKPRKLNPRHFDTRWQELQKLCANRKTWPQAIIEADNLLDEALKKSRFKGKTPGERLVSAQHHLSTNDLIWLGHKLRNHISQDEVDVRTLKKKDVIDSLAGFRQALRDLGALETHHD